MKKMQVLIVTIILLGSMSIFSQPNPKGQQPMVPRGNQINQLLKLTPDQEKKFDDMKYQQQQSAIDINSKIQKNRLELKKTIDDGKIDENKILQLTNENSKLQGELKLSVIKHGLDIYKMLNDDQKAIFLKHLARLTDGGMMRGRMNGGMIKGMQGRGMNRMQGGGMGRMRGRGMNGMQGGGMGHMPGHGMMNNNGL